MVQQKAIFKEDRMNNKIKHIREYYPLWKVNIACDTFVSAMQMCTRSQSKMDFLTWVLDKCIWKLLLQFKCFQTLEEGVGDIQRLLEILTKCIFPRPDLSLMHHTLGRYSPEGSQGILMQPAHTPGDRVVEFGWQRHLKPSEAFWVHQNHSAGQGTVLWFYTT